MDSMKLNEVFDTRISNALFRKGIFTIGELKEYAREHPYAKRTALEWSGIGKKTYELIEYIIKIES